MMAQYSRQHNTDMEEVEDRALSPTSEVLSDPTGGAVRFMSPSLKYRMRSTSLWNGRTGIEKSLLVCVGVLLVACLALTVAVASFRQEEGRVNIKLLHPDSPCKEDEQHKGMEQEHKKPADIHNKTRNVCLTPDCIKVSAAIMGAADFTVDPCEDFYQYACGGWIRSNPIPDGKSSWNTFKKLWQNNQNTLRNLLERNQTEKDRECAACTKARDYYSSCVDGNGTLEQLGGKPLINIMKNYYWNVTDFDGSGQLENWTLQNVTENVQHTYNVGGFFIWNVGEDDKNSSRHVLQIDQGGLTLNTREQYINKTYENDTVLAALLQVMVETSLLLYKEKRNQTEDIPDIIKEDITRQMKDVIDFEIQLAGITKPASEQRNGEDRYNNYTIEKLQVEVDFFNWKHYFENAFKWLPRKIKPTENIIVYSPDYLIALGKLIKEKLATNEGKNTLNNYMVWQIVKNFNMALSKQYRDVDKVLQKALSGADVHEERWRICITDVDNVLGFAVGAQFVNQTFDKKTKPEAEEMIKLITKAFRQGLVEAEWMDEKTRYQAEKKADKIANMIGYPDYIVNNTALEEKYKDLSVGDGYFESNLNFNRWVLEENLKKLDKPVERNKWGMTPSTINAYYTPLKNQIVFPAGILQAPFFSMNRPQSLNFGAMGVVMGHELSHAFDDQGRQYDADGNMRNWWKNDTLEAYKEKIKCVEKEYGNFTVNGEHINGLQTLGENIADNGGLKAAFRAFTNLSDAGKNWSYGDLPGLNMTDNQLFFLSFAQVWCDISTPQASHLSAMEDAHSPPRLRVMGTLSNSPDFAKEFKCAEGSRMNPADPEYKCEVW
eukprot:GFUD01080095.1.p1 GENE.GFUD01080095.1~~GFUD01080095.1.p1  ORF type:complete len:831 (-),score=230.51 GFUD01080095.1:109-2601(-)